MQVLNQYGLQAIETKYLSPTNHRGSRIIAKAAAGKVIVDWDYSLSDKENHDQAALELAKKFGWDDYESNFVMGGKPDCTGNVYVMINDRMMKS